MVIKQQMPSNTGYFNFNILRNVSKVEKRDNLLIEGLDKPHNVLVLHLPNIKYYMRHFPSREKRDAAYDSIINSRGSVCLLDYSEYFCEEVLMLSACMKLVASKFQLFAQLKSRIENESDLKTMHAFTACRDLHPNILTGSPVPVKNTDLANLWAGTLSCPAHIRKLGLTPKQFWQVLIKRNNEIFFNSNNSDSLAG